MGTSGPLPEGITSYLDTDLYKLTMQSAVLHYFPSVLVEYKFTNRTPAKRLTRQAFDWLQEQVLKLGNIRLQDDELQFLKKECPYLDKGGYLEWLNKLVLRPKEQVELGFERVDGEEAEVGDVSMKIKGLWVETILYEVPLLALTSEAYFRFVDTDWSHEGQGEAAFQKGLSLFKGGCIVSDFGSRRRRDWKTQDLVVDGLKRASLEVEKNGGKGVGKLTGSSNVFFAMRHGLHPIGTVAHEWYMGIASISDDYRSANEMGLKYWVEYFGEGVLGIALTDTFGTPAFFEAFKKKTSMSDHSYAQVFAGIRQDSGDPKDYVKLAADFYKSQGITGKSIVFSDSLNVEKCLEYKAVAEREGFVPSFGVGTFFTNDYKCKSDSTKKSKPLNIVIKISKAGGRHSVKISDNIGKNTGDQATVERVKRELGYTEKGLQDIDEAKRW